MWNTVIRWAVHLFFYYCPSTPLIPFTCLRAAPRCAATVRLIAGRLREQEHVLDHFHCLAPYSLSAPHTCWDVRYFRPSDWLLQQSALSLLIGLTKHTPRSLAADGRKCTCSKRLCHRVYMLIDGHPYRQPVGLVGYNTRELATVYVDRLSTYSEDWTR